MSEKSENNEDKKIDPEKIQQLVEDLQHETEDREEAAARRDEPQTGPAVLPLADYDVEMTTPQTGPREEPTRISGFQLFTLFVVFVIVGGGLIFVGMNYFNNRQSDEPKPTKPFQVPSGLIKDKPADVETAPQAGEVVPEAIVEVRGDGWLAHEADRIRVVFLPQATEEDINAFIRWEEVTPQGSPIYTGVNWELVINEPVQDAEEVRERLSLAPNVVALTKSWATELPTRPDMWRDTLTEEQLATTTDGTIIRGELKMVVSDTYDNPSALARGLAFSTQADIVDQPDFNTFIFAYEGIETPEQLESMILNLSTEPSVEQITHHFLEEESSEEIEEESVATSSATTTLETETLEE